MRNRGTSRILVVGLVAAAAVTAQTSSTGAADDPAPATAPRVKTSTLSPTLAKIADLTNVATDRALAQSAGLPETGAGSLTRSRDGRLVVDVTLNDSSDAALESLERIGAQVIATDGGPVIATVAIPIASLRTLADQPVIDYVTQVHQPIRLGSPSMAPVPRHHACATGTVVSEADEQLRAHEARSTYGVDGTGVRIGVLSDSYDQLGGASADIATGDLPGAGNPCGRTTPVDVLEELPATSNGIDEGRGMMQLIHDLAPGAEMTFATAFLGEIAMAEQIEALGATDVDIITDDIIYTSEPMFQDGPIAQAIEHNRMQRGIPHFSAAGNFNTIVGGNNVASYDAPALRPIACPPAIPDYIADCHNFNTGGAADSTSSVTLEPGGVLEVVLGWNEPMYGVTTDLDLYLIDSATNQIQTASESNNDSSKRAVEFVSFRNESGVLRTFDLVIGRFISSTAGEGTPRLKYVMLSADGVTNVEYAVSAGGDIVGPTMFGHAAEPTAIAVGAVPFNNSAMPERFSSRGPSTQCWRGVDGTEPQPALPSCSTSTIDLAATDGAVTNFFGTKIGEDFRFFGTSAAAPHAAAVAALVMEARPCAGSDQIEASLVDGAVPVGTFDADAIGAGLVDAVAAIEVSTSSCAPSIEPIADISSLAGEPLPTVAIAIADEDTDDADLITTATTDNPGLIPASGLTLTGAAPLLELSIVPTPNASGTAEITITVTDPDGLEAIATFLVEITETQAFTALNPARFADSRNQETVDNRFRNTGPRVADSIWEIDIAGRGDVPADAQAAIINLTVLNGDGPGFATAYPCGARPGTSSVNYQAGTVDPNEVIVKLSGSGTVCVYTLTRADVIVDVVGYVEPTSPYEAIAPERHADSRPEPTVDNQFRATGQRGAGTTWEILVAGRGAVPAEASSIVANLTVTGGTAPGFATVYPCGTRPNASSLNYGVGDTRPNEVITKLSADGTICVFTLSDVHVIVDVVGHLSGTAGLTTISPTRYADSRAEATFDGAFRNTGKIPAEFYWEIEVGGRGGVPADASLAIANITVVDPEQAGFITVFPCATLPTASSLNYGTGTVRANEVVAKLSPTGHLCVYTRAAAHIIVDIAGYR